MLRVRILLRRGVLDTTLCVKVCQWLVTGLWFSPGSLVANTNKTDCHDITEILLKVASNTIYQTKSSIVCDERWLLVLDSSGIILTLFFHKEENKIHVPRFVTSLCVICFINFSSFILSFFESGTINYVYLLQSDCCGNFVEYQHIRYVHKLKKRIKKYIKKIPPYLHNYDNKKRMPKFFKWLLSFTA